MSRIRVNGVELSYSDQGTGLPLVLLHGWSMSGRFFQRQLEALSQRHRVIVPDLRGHGQSEKVLGGHTVQTYAADVGALLEALGVGDFVVLGWSMGVMVAYELLQGSHGAHCVGLVITEQGPSDFAWPDWPLGVFTASDLAAANKTLQEDPAALASEFVDLMIHREDAPTKAWMVEEMLKTPPAIAGSILLDQTLSDYREYVATIAIPTLLVFGEDPKLLDPAAGAWIGDRIPGSTLVTVPESSHCPFYEQADVYNAHVLRFTGTLGEGTAP